MSGFLDWLAPLAQIGGSLYGAYSANNAANTAAQAGNNALSLQAQMYNQNRSDLAPWRQAGQQVLGTLVPQVNQGFQQSPGYQFQQDEAMRVLNNRLAGMGMTNSGMAQREAMRVASGLAAQDYNNYWNRAAGIAGVGQNAANTGVAAAGNYANQGSNILQNIGSAQASGITQGANAINSGINNLSAWWANNQGGYKPQGYGGGSGGMSAWGS